MSQEGSAGRDLIQVGRDYIRHINVNIASGNWLMVGVSLLPVIATLLLAGTGVKLTVEVVQKHVIPKIAGNSGIPTPQVPPSTSPNPPSSSSENSSQDEPEIGETEMAANVKKLQTSKKCRKCDLSGADLKEANLVGADLRQANLSGAQLNGASLKDANLSQAILEGTNLHGAELVNTDLSNAQLKGANLNYANLGLANFGNANLSRADLSNADISFGVKFSGTDLSRADLRGTKKSNQWFEEWEGINLCGAKMPDDGTESQQGC